MTSAMEDSGTMQSLTFLSQAGRVDLQRVLVLQRRSEATLIASLRKSTAAESLAQISPANYSAYLPALEAAQLVGDKVVRDIVEHWTVHESEIPHLP